MRLFTKKFITATFVILSACNEGPESQNYYKSNTRLSEVSDDIYLIDGTEKLSSCPTDMYIDDEGVNRVCVIFPNDELNTESPDYRKEYEAQISRTKWSQPKRIGNITLFQDSTDERTKFKERLTCVKMLSLVVWYDGEAKLVDAAIKKGQTAQFPNKILGISVIGNECK